MGEVFEDTKQGTVVKRQLGK